MAANRIVVRKPYALNFIRNVILIYIFGLKSTRSIEILINGIWWLEGYR